MRTLQLQNSEEYIEDNHPYKRDDLASYLIHLTKGENNESAYITLLNIIREGRIKASTQEYITKYDPKGVSCFYDIPLNNSFRQLIKTNPQQRKPYGIIVSKYAFWCKGGRPVIYTDIIDKDQWPLNVKI